MPCRVLLADDEPLLRDHLAAELERLWPEAEIRPAADGDEAVEIATQWHPDVVFLDIRMPGRNGLEVAAALPTGVNVVFVTAYDQYAVTAFEQAAVDYLLKPVLPQRLAITVQRLREVLAAQRVATIPADLLASLQRQLGIERVAAGSGAQRFLEVQTGRELHLLPLAEVVCFRADAKYTVVHTAEREFLMRTPLKELEAQLDSELFWRVHRSSIVSARHIRRARRDLTGRWRLTLDGHDDEITVSSRYADRLRGL